MDLQEINSLFQRKPCVSEDILSNHLDEMLILQDLIKKQLKDYVDFDGIDFCDFGLDKIQIRGFHKQIEGYSFMDVIMKQDFSNAFSCIIEFIEKWKQEDNPKNIRMMRNFIEDCNKYGWD